jgi:hypothetical protein
MKTGPGERELVKKSKGIAPYTDRGGQGAQIDVKRIDECYARLSGPQGACRTEAFIGETSAQLSIKCGFGKLLDSRVRRNVFVSSCSPHSDS